MTINTAINLQSTYLGFIDTLTPMQKSKVEKILSDSKNYNGTIMSNKQFIFNQLISGSTPQLIENYQYYKRDGELTKPKTDYRIKLQDNSFYQVEKTLYNFAVYLAQNGFTDEQKANEFITTEQNHLAQLAQKEFDRKQQEKQHKKLLQQQKQEFNNWLSEQAENYSDNTKLDIAKDIFLDCQGDYNELYLCKLLVTIDNIDILACKEKLKNSLYSHNKTSKKVFYYVTGIKLPTTDKGTFEILNSLTVSSYQGIVSYKKKQSKTNNNNNNDTKTESKLPITEVFYKSIRKPSPHYEECTGIPLSKYGLDMFITQYSDGTYQLSEAKSGMLMIDADTKKKLMDKLKDVINLHGIEKINRMIQDNINSNGIGISPKYQDVV